MRQNPFEYTTNSQGLGRPYTTGVSFEIPVEIAHKRGYRVDRAESLAEVARLNIANEAWKVRGQVRDALFGIYVSQQRITLLQQKVTTEEQIVAMLRKRRLVGEASGTDVTQMELALSQARIDFAVLLRALQYAQAVRLHRFVNFELSNRSQAGRNSARRARICGWFVLSRCFCSGCLSLRFPFKVSQR